MATAHALVTPRDLDILSALEMSPLTARQLLRLSETFDMPFTNERKVRARMHTLAMSGRVLRWPYAIAGRGWPTAYSITRDGYRILYGEDAPEPGKRSFRAVGISHQQHTLALAEFLVHTLVSAQKSDVRFMHIARENGLCLTAGQEHLYPDKTFALRPMDGREFLYYVELDNRTERIQSQKDCESWDRKIRLYEAIQDQSPVRFRVLVLATRGSDRLQHILTRAGELARNPKRSLFYGAELPNYLAEEEPLASSCFLDHRLERVPLIPPEPSRKIARSLPVLPVLAAA